MILDGRNRNRACQSLGILSEPRPEKLVRSRTEDTVMGPGDRGGGLVQTSKPMGPPGDFNGGCLGRPRRVVRQSAGSLRMRPGGDLQCRHQARPVDSPQSPRVALDRSRVGNLQCGLPHGATDPNAPRNTTMRSLQTAASASILTLSWSAAGPRWDRPIQASLAPLEAILGRLRGLRGRRRSIRRREGRAEEACHRW